MISVARGRGVSSIRMSDPQISPSAVLEMFRPPPANRSIPYQPAAERHARAKASM